MYSICLTLVTSGNLTRWGVACVYARSTQLDSPAAHTSEMLYTFAGYPTRRHARAGNMILFANFERSVRAFPVVYSAVALKAQSRRTALSRGF